MEKARQLFTASPVRKLILDLPDLQKLSGNQMLTYLTAKGLSDAQIQLISGHESKKSLEVYQHLSLESVDKAYQDAVQTVWI
jgi:hypothetical protein